MRLQAESLFSSVRDERVMETFEACIDSALMHSVQDETGALR